VGIRFIVDLQANLNLDSDLAVSIEAHGPRLMARYKKEEARLQSEIKRSERKLADERFVANAKPEVVAKEREKLAGYQRERERVVKLLSEIGQAG